MLRASRCLPSSLVALSLAGCAFVSNTRLEAQLDKDGDGVMVSIDCDDRDPSVGNTLLYRDADGDGFGQGLPERRCGAAEGWAATGGDCDDLRDTVHPDADERCNSIDDNCDGDIDGEDAVDPLSWYADLDADGFGQPSEEPLGVACDAPSALTADNALDCDDGNAAVGDRRAFFEDQDGDGFGNADVAVAACEPPEGFVEQVLNLGMPNQGYDCDDTNPAINPGAPEICDAADTDENCNGLTDDDDPDFDPTMVRGLWFADRDGDGFGSTAETVRSCDLPPSEPHAFGDETHVAHAWTVDSRDCEDDPEDEAAVDLEAPQDCDIEQIAVGVDTGCYREANGFVGCIGDNRSIVDGVPEISFVSIDVGREHACGVTVEGELACWGEGPAEEGGPLYEAAPAANAVSLQLNHTCILTPQGTLECWAEDISYSVVSGDEAGNGYVQVSAGTGHGCAIVGSSTGGAAGAVDCFGGGCSSDGECADADGVFLQVGAGDGFTCGLQSYGGGADFGTLDCWGAPPASWSLLDGAYTSVSVGPRALCATSREGAVACVADDDLALLEPPPELSFDAVDVGVNFACGIFGDNDYACWGPGFSQSSDPDWTPPEGTLGGTE